MKITHLRYVAIAAPAFADSAAFFGATWGLEPVPSSDGVGYFRSQADEAFQVALHPADRRGIVRIGLGLGSEAEVDAAAGELRDAGVRIVAEPARLDTPGGGYGLRCLDPDGRCIELSAGVAKPGPGVDRPATPLYLSHVVLNTPDLDRSTDFYTEILGFRVSDWSEHVMSFLRCNAEHHSIAFNQAPHASYNHSSWQMRSIDELFRGQGRLKAAGTPLAWGTGRHAPGKQVFNYFVEPSGYVVEYIADGETVEDEATWQIKVYGRTPEAMDLWNTSGPPSPAIRAAMTGEPDPGYTEPSLSRSS
jgi:catechol 2,3-dioxygenase-like lactoylglutathione lyase family enzyme